MNLKEIRRLSCKWLCFGFEESDISLRTEPKNCLPHASIIAIAVGYPNKLKGAPKSVRGDRRGMFARASWGKTITLLCVNV